MRYARDTLEGVKALQLLLLASFFPAVQITLAQMAAPAQNVVLVMTDGLRWQELFRGANASLLTPANFYGGRKVDALQQQFLAPTPEERRRLLMPFLWSTMAQQGEIFGDRDQGSDVAVTNGFNFSYPGYSETLTGHGDPRIHSNDNIPNPNQTVLEWLGKRHGFENSVAAFGAWEVISGIVNRGRCGCVVNAGYEPLHVPPVTAELALINSLKANSPRIWDDEVLDAPEFETAMGYVRLHHPRVLFLSLGETDDWAHGGNYGEYLLSAHRVDAYLQRLWSALQSMPEYKSKTTLIFTTDHGRGGDADKGWQTHGGKVPESKYIFLGLLGAGVPANGVRSNTPPLTQSQIAATLARFVGQDWNAAEPSSGKPISMEPLSTAVQPRGAKLSRLSAE